MGGRKRNRSATANLVPEISENKQADEFIAKLAS